MFFLGQLRGSVRIFGVLSDASGIVPPVDQAGLRCDQEVSIDVSRTDQQPRRKGFGHVEEHREATASLLGES